MTTQPDHTAARRFRKKPVQVEAMQLIDDLRNHQAVARWIESNGGHAEIPFVEPCVYIETLEGQMRADIGDYVIRGIKGEFYPCKPDIFEATYDEVPCRTCAGQGWTGNRQTGPGMRHYHCPCGRPCRACDKVGEFDVQTG